MQILQGQLVDIHQKRIYPVELHIQNQKIKDILPIDEAPQRFFTPGFVDAHIHIESSMLVPSEFARIAVQHGTVATVSDPHEIANVLGVPGVDFMIENGKKAPLKFFFGAPSCVPATAFESAGAEINAEEIGALLQRPEVKYLAEMMNYPGVILGDEQVHKKLAQAKKTKKPIDGHAPGLRGKDAKTYFSYGISTDHECFSYDEALEKLGLGVKVLIREGSAAKNYTALAPLIKSHAEQLMFCSDDKHPDDLLEGHINQLVKRAWQEGYDFWDVLQMACKNPVAHYNLEVGMLRKGDFADFLVLNDLHALEVSETWINGEKVFCEGETQFDSVDFDLPNRFAVGKKQASDFALTADSDKIRVIEAIDGELITNQIELSAQVEEGYIVPNIENDILKITVVNRYENQPPAVGFIRNFGLKKGAIASSVAHDCHNIVAVGCSDVDLEKAVNLLIENMGGLAAVDATSEKVIPLPVAGIMSDKSAQEIGESYKALDRFAKELGCSLNAPYMSLSFMALLVIPRLKLSDKGLFDGETFEFVETTVKL